MKEKCKTKKQKKTTTQNKDRKEQQVTKAIVKG